MATQKDGVPVLLIETLKQGDSGFIMDGTERTQFEQSLRTPTIEWIPTQGIEAYMDDKGIKRHRPIQHIRGCESIYPKEQELAGFKPNRMADKIPLDNGFANIKREGSTIGTYDFISKATYFFDNPLRPESATPLYKEIKINEKAVEIVDEDELLTAAKSKVYSLRMNIGGEKKMFKYDTDKINSYSRLLGIVEDSPETQLLGLLKKAASNPKDFLDVIVKAEQTVITEVSHALQLGVIMFDKNTAQYTKESKVITSVGTGNLSETKKIEALANYLQTPEGTNELTELRAKLEMAKELQFSTK